MTVPTSEHGREASQAAQLDQDAVQAAHAGDEPGSDNSANDTAGVRGTGGYGLAALRVPPWSRSPVLLGVFALAVYLAVWLCGWELPLLRHANLALLDQSSQDPNFYIWSLRWWPYAVAHGLNPLVSKEIGAPAGFNMTWTTTIPPLALIASPLTLLVGAVRSFNVLVAIAPPLSAWATFIACRRLTGKFWPALLGGAVYGLSAYETGHTTVGQLNLTWNLLPPLMVYLVALRRDQKLSRPWFVSIMALAMLLQFFLFDETFFELTALLAIGLPVGYALAGRANRWVVAALARQVGAAWVIAMVIASPYLLYALSHYPSGFSRSPATTELNLASLVVPRPTGSFGISWLMDHSHRLPPTSVGYVGLPVLLIVLALAIRTWHSKMTRFAVVMFVVTVALAAGPSLVIGSLHVGSVPWAKLWLLPVARSALPNRFILLGGLVLAVIVTMWLAAPGRSLGLHAVRPGAGDRVRASSARWGVALLAVIAILADAPPTASFDLAAPTNHIPTFFTAGQYRHYIKPGEIMLVISERGNAAMLFQAYTNFDMRVAGGYINKALTPRNDLPPQVIALAHADRAREARFIAYLKTAGVKAIVVERSWQPLWVGVLRKMGLKGKAIGGVIFYPIGPCVTRCRSSTDDSHTAGQPS